MFTDYHAHLYFDKNTMSTAEELSAKADALFPIKVGRFHSQNVGPHPCWSCQLTFKAEAFSTLVPWLNLNREGLTVFIHPITDNSLKDHKDYAMWLGESKELNLSIFE